MVLVVLVPRQVFLEVMVAFANGRCAIGHHANNILAMPVDELSLS